MSFSIAPISDERPHLPVPVMQGNQTSIGLEAITDPSSSTLKYREMWDPDQPHIGPYFLPPFQRPAVWTDEQKIRLVESVLLGISIGSIVVVDAMNLPMQGENRERFATTDRWLIDGQQRCNALLDYRASKITVFAGTPCEHRFEDLNEIERRRFRNMQIGLIKIETDDIEYCKELYDRLNFGGTAHTQDQRAISA